MSEKGDEKETEKMLPPTLSAVPASVRNNNIRASSVPTDNRKKLNSASTLINNTLNEESTNSNENFSKLNNSKCARFDFSGSTGLDDELCYTKQEDEWEWVPPDGGWGWLILLGSMMVNILVPGTVKSFGVLFVEFLEVFEASPAAAAWIPALCYFLYSSLGPLSSILSVKYSYRTVTILGGTFAAVGMIVSFWASSVTYLYFSYGILVGTGAGLSFPPTVYIVTSYFVRLRGLANGLCISGSALGSIILPPVLRILLEYYGYRGAVLIMGGITLHVWVGALFYDPVEKHLKRVLKTSYDDAMSITSGDLQNESKAPLNQIESKQNQIIHSSTIDESTAKLHDKLLTSDKSSSIFVRSASSAAVQNFQSPVLERTRKISMPMPKEMNNSQMHSTPALHAVPESVVHNHTSFDYFSQTNLPSSRVSSRVRLPIRSPSTSSFNYVSTPYHGSTLSAIHPQQFASSLTLKSITFSPISKCKHAENNKIDEENSEETTQKLFDISLLKDPIYLIILISNSTNAISYTNFIILLPAYATSLGFDKTSAAYLISVVSALDLVGRIGGSALSDLNLIPKTWYFIGGLLVSGFGLAILPSTNTYSMICVCCGIFGLASGIYVGITAIIMADMLGEDRLTSTYGISLFVNGILQLIGPPLCGVWVEFSHNSYDSLFFALGLILIAGSSIWSFVPFIRRNKKKEVIENNSKLLK
ncbi:uncharacterized protein LOC123302738 [Chrysoperla carnea]|uniref:uncharacterized protein LOC123302738 n=1 Tax=Chrysoperla carnea TaxID=189513 RepID=UPI001D06DEA4|nr:uncharacterized protein LOC123302738 [Chrysoperla carnea]